MIEGRTAVNPAASGHQALVVNADGSINTVTPAGGILDVRAAATSIDVSGFATSSIVLAAPGRLVAFVGRNVGAATVFIMFFDSLVVPGALTLPDRLPIRVAAGAAFSLQQASDFAVGIVWAASSTDALLTIIAGADVWTDTFFVP